MSDALVHQFADLLKASTHLFELPVEKNFTPEYLTNFAANNYPLCFGLVAAYLIFISAGSLIMNKFKPFDLRLSLAAWNAFLCIFSFIGMCRTVPYLASMLLTQNYKDTVCTNPIDSWGSGPTGMWVMLFIFSKVPELIDTVFIVLRKKPLIFLHWYHHVTVLLFCWNAYATLAGSGLYFVAMNYTVHALMYGYYCLQALNCCPKSFPTILITLMQIAQMFVGTGVCISCWYYLLSATEGSVSCSNDLSNLIAGGLMYGSYLYLFVEFAVGRYGPGKKSKKSKDAAAKKLE